MIINIVLFIVMILTGMVLINYNRFIRTNNKVKETESQIDILLKKRFDLLPNLIECVKGYTKHENETLTDLTKMRSNYDKSDFSIDETEKIDKKFGKILAIAEAYPDLKASEQFLNLQDNLLKIEDELNESRLYYNRIVTHYNNLVEVIPSNIVAKMFSFEKKELFKVDDANKENVKVEL